MPNLTTTSGNRNGALTTIQRVRDELIITDNDSDTILNHYIDEASAAIRRYCGRDFGRARVTEILGSYGGPELIVAHTPIVTVHAVYSGASPNSTRELVASGNYFVSDQDAGFIRSNWSFWNRTTVVRQDLLRHETADSPVPDYEADYTGGFILPAEDPTVKAARDLPFEIEAACVETVVAKHAGRGNDPRLKSEKIGDWSGTFELDATTGLTKTAMGQLTRWRRTAIGA